MDEDAVRYLPGMDKLRYQGKIYFVKTLKQATDSTYTGFTD